MACLSWLPALGVSWTGTSLVCVWLGSDLGSWKDGDIVYASVRLLVWGPVAEPRGRSNVMEIVWRKRRTVLRLDS